MSDLPRLTPGSVFLLLLMGVAVMGGAKEDPCKCFLLEKEYDWSLLSSDHCCVRLRLSVDSLEWNIFTSLPALRILDLSGSGILEITDGVRGTNRTGLEFLYLNDNHLKDLPDGFLRNAPNLKVLHVENNELRRLPENFLEISNQIQEIHLNSNHLNSLPADLLKPSLTKLNFLNNSLDCTCVLYDQLGAKLRDNRTSSLLDGVICAAPHEVRGLQIVEVERGRLCRSHGLTAALICVPLGALLLFLCWYCCCRRKKGSYTGAGRECRLVTVDRNGAGNAGGEYHHYEPQHKNRTEAEPGQFKDPILLKPSAALLGSSRDLYEEVEIKLGTSADSLVRGEGQVCQEGPGLTLAVEDEEEEEEEEEELKAEIEGDTVSVTEVMKDSTDREKLYLNQSTDYYSLVPGIELEDSDHGDYESVDLT